MAVGVVRSTCVPHTTGVSGQKLAPPQYISRDATTTRCVHNGENPGTPLASGAMAMSETLYLSFVTRAITNETNRTPVELSAESASPMLRA